MKSRRLWAQIAEMSEDELRTQVILPLLAATPGVDAVSDVHGSNERGLDVIFCVSSRIEELTYGLQLKVGNISGGGTASGTVKQIIDQLGLANDFDHPVVVRGIAKKIDRFVVATNGKFSTTAREEITRRTKPIPVQFWDGTEIVKRIHATLPQMFELTDGETVLYLRRLRERYDVLDALDQIPGVARRTLSQIFVERRVRRKYDPAISGGASGEVARGVLPALSLTSVGHNSVLVGDQDSGKTSLLRMLAISQAQRLLEGGTGAESHGTAVPVLVRARDALGSALTFKEALESELRRLESDALVATLQGDLEAGNYLVLVDGLSDLPKEEDKHRFGRMVEEFAATHPETRVIVVANTVDFLSPTYLPTFFQYALTDFDNEQVSALLKKWTAGSKAFEDVGPKMVERLREALQLPGSPIPATIGVMLHEKENKFVTNTAEAIDRYMVIRLGRYAHELGMRAEVEWTRKQDLLAEVAFDMVSESVEILSEADFVARFNLILQRQGDDLVGAVVFRELRESSVLVSDAGGYAFNRSSFRDFFAGHHIFRHEQLEDFAVQRLTQREWAGPIVFAAGLKRANTDLLARLAGAVERRLSARGDSPDDDDLFSTYVLGRVLSNSENSDNSARMAALRTVVTGARLAIPGFERLIVEQYGAIGKLLALLGAEQSLFVTLGVPWLRSQFEQLMDDATLKDEERFLLGSVYAQLGFPDSYDVLLRAVRSTRSTRVIVALEILVRQLVASRRVSGTEGVALEELETLIRRKLAGRQDEVRSVLELRAPVLEVERKRLRRVFKAAKKK